MLVGEESRGISWVNSISVHSDIVTSWHCCSAFHHMQVITGEQDIGFSKNEKLLLKGRNSVPIVEDREQFISVFVIYTWYFLKLHQGLGTDSNTQQEELLWALPPSQACSWLKQNHKGLFLHKRSVALKDLMGHWVAWDGGWQKGCVILCIDLKCNLGCSHMSEFILTG